MVRLAWVNLKAEVYAGAVTPLTSMRERGLMGKSWLWTNTLS